MNKLGTYFVAFLLAAIAPLPTVAAEDAKTAIENLLNTYQERLSNNDLDGILDLYSANPVFIPEYAPPAVGRDSVRKAYEWVFATLKLRGNLAMPSHRDLCSSLVGHARHAASLTAHQFHPPQG